MRYLIARNSGEGIVFATKKEHAGRHPSIQLLIPILVTVLIFAALSVDATPYYVATHGSDSNPGTLDMPFQTVNRGVRALQPGGTLYIREGVYQEALIRNIPSGSADHPVTVSAYPGESVTLRPHSGYRVVEFLNQRHIVMDGLTLDGVNVQSNVVKFYRPADYITVQNSEIMRAPVHGILGAGSHVRFTNIQLHSNGRIDDYLPGHTGIYWSGDHTILEHSEIYNNNGSGINFWQSVTGPDALPIGNNIARYNHIYDNNRIGIGQASDRRNALGIFCGSAFWPTSCTLHDNVIAGNDSGIQINNHVVQAEIFNNTITGNTAPQGACILVSQGAIGVSIADNTCEGNRMSIVDYSSRAILTSNTIDRPAIISPEPTSFLLLGSGIGWLAFSRCRHQVWQRSGG